MLLLDGLTYDGIAAKLGVKPNTVRFHCKNIYRKCDVNHREALVRKIDAAIL